MSYPDNVVAPLTIPPKPDDGLKYELVWVNDYSQEPELAHIRLENGTFNEYVWPQKAEWVCVKPRRQVLPKSLRRFLNQIYNLFVPPVDESNSEETDSEILRYRMAHGVPSGYA